MDAILFSADPAIAYFEDAIEHLKHHKELYWEVGFPIKKDRFPSFPIWGFIHVNKLQVKYRATITKIVPFDKQHYEDTAFAEQVKPQSWLLWWKKLDEGEKKRWKHALVMTELVRFDYNTRSLKKTDGSLITKPPQNYARVIPPFQTILEPEHTTPLDSPDLLAQLDTLDERRDALFRTEQRILRALVVGTHGTATCQLCGREFPVELLVAAHIKRRADCTEIERRDIKNVIALCKLGCDELLEKGYIVVRDGVMHRGARSTTEAVHKYVGDLAGRNCPGWTDGRASYFEWRAHAVGQPNSN